MDAVQFDTFTREMTATFTRRGVVGLGLASLVTGFMEESVAAKHHGRRKKSCPKKRIKYFGCTTFSHKHCRKKKKPNGAKCQQNGQCFSGLCYLSPTCQGVQGSVCTTGDECCSGDCAASACAPGVAGKPCGVDGDCQSGECVGFHCM